MIVKTLPASVLGCTSAKPMVDNVQTVMYIASSTPTLSMTEYPIVPATTRMNGTDIRAISRGGSR